MRELETRAGASDVRPTLHTGVNALLEWSSLIEDALAYRTVPADRDLGPQAALFIDFALREARA